jgi:hypothetical protein
MPEDTDASAIDQQTGVIGSVKPRQRDLTRGQAVVRRSYVDVHAYVEYPRHNNAYAFQSMGYSLQGMEYALQSMEFARQSSASLDLNGTERAAIKPGTKPTNHAMKRRSQVKSQPNSVTSVTKRRGNQHRIFHSQLRANMRTAMKTTKACMKQLP